MGEVHKYIYNIACGSIKVDKYITYYKLIKIYFNNIFISNLIKHPIYILVKMDASASKSIMPLRYLGNTGIKVSVLSYGNMFIPSDE